MLGKRGLTISSIVTIIILSFGVLGLVGYSFSAERTANLSPVSCEQADVNRDGRVDLIDMSFVKSKDGCDMSDYENCGRFDLNGDGKVNLIDMALVKSMNGMVCWVLYDDFS